MIYPNQFLSKAHEERRIICRRIVNLLSACKLYLDQIIHHLSNIYGSDSEQIALVIEEKSNQYDNLLGYRVMEALRNHVQHRGYPIHTIKYSSRLVEDHVLYTVIPQIEIKYFIDDKKFKKSVLSEISNLGEKIDINQFIREFLEGLGTIQSKVRAILQEDLVNWEKLLSEIEMRFIEASSPDISLAGLALVREDDEKYVETSIVNTDIAKRRRALASKNDHFNGLSYRYVSNKI